MKSSPVYRRTGAFTLIELLCVISIIGILAALLLPVLARGKAQAKTAFCSNNLYEIGEAFQMFSHDHDSRFPWQVSETDGGSVGEHEWGNGLNPSIRAVAPQLSVSPTSFQSVGGELLNPNIVVCPSDARKVASSFDTLRDVNVSYFTDGDADYFQPESIMAGDRNLAIGSSQTETNATLQLNWTKSQHHLRGNVLYADGHVEMMRNFYLAARPVLWQAAAATAPAQNPSLSPEENGAISSLLKNSGIGLPAAILSSLMSTPGTPADNNNGDGRQSRNFGTSDHSKELAAVTMDGGQLTPLDASVENHAQTGGLAPIAMQTSLAAPIPTAELADMSFFDHHIRRTTGIYFAWGYGLLLLLEMLWLSYRVWRRLHQQGDQSEKNKSE